MLPVSRCWVEGLETKYFKTVTSVKNRNAVGRPQRRFDCRERLGPVVRVTTFCRGQNCWWCGFPPCQKKLGWCTAIFVRVYPSPWCWLHIPTPLAAGSEVTLHYLANFRKLLITQALGFTLEKTSPRPGMGRNPLCEPRETCMAHKCGSPVLKPCLQIYFSPLSLGSHWPRTNGCPQEGRFFPSTHISMFEPSRPSRESATLGYGRPIPGLVRVGFRFYLRGDGTASQD